MSSYMDKYRAQFAPAIQAQVNPQAAQQPSVGMQQPNMGAISQQPQPQGAFNNFAPEGAINEASKPPADAVNFTKMWNQNSQKEQGEIVNQHFPSADELQSKYAQAQAKGAVPDDKEHKITRNEKGALLMELGLRLMSYSGQMGFGEAAGKAGLDVLQGIRAKKESAASEKRADQKTAETRSFEIDKSAMEQGSAAGRNRATEEGANSRARGVQEGENARGVEDRASRERIAKIGADADKATAGIRERSSAAGKRVRDVDADGNMITTNEDGSDPRPVLDTQGRPVKPRPSEVKDIERAKAITGEAARLSKEQENVFDPSLKKSDEEIMAQATQNIDAALKKPDGTEPVASSPPVSMLKEGVKTKFKDGSAWTLKGGKAVKVQ